MDGNGDTLIRLAIGREGIGPNKFYSVNVLCADGVVVLLSTHDSRAQAKAALFRALRAWDLVNGDEMVEIAKRIGEAIGKQNV